MALSIKKRCIRCRKYLRADGTCQNPDCVRFVPEATATAEAESAEAEEENKGENSRP